MASPVNTLIVSESTFTHRLHRVDASGVSRCNPHTEDRLQRKWLTFTVNTLVAIELAIAHHSYTGEAGGILWP